MNAEAVVADVTGCRKKETVTEVDCGKIIATEFFSADDVLVRRDIQVQVSEIYMAKMLAGPSE